MKKTKDTRTVYLGKCSIIGCRNNLYDSSKPYCEECLKMLEKGRAVEQRRRDFINYFK